MGYKYCKGVLCIIWEQNFFCKSGLFNGYKYTGVPMDPLTVKELNTNSVDITVFADIGEHLHVSEICIIVHTSKFCVMISSLEFPLD